MSVECIKKNNLQIVHKTHQRELDNKVDISAINS